MIRFIPAKPHSGNASANARLRESRKGRRNCLPYKSLSDETVDGKGTPGVLNTSADVILIQLSGVKGSNPCFLANSIKNRRLLLPSIAAASEAGASGSCVKTGSATVACGNCDFSLRIQYPSGFVLDSI